MWKRFFLPIFQAEKIIKEYRREQQWVQMRNTTLFTAGAFLIMSVLNVLQHATFMLLTTLGGAAGLLICLALGWRKKRTKPMEIAFLIIFALVLTYYIIAGGNDGFAILWVVFVPLMFMMMIDVKIGLILSTYFLLLLFLVFYGPLEFLLQYAYSEMMRLRFPVLYLIDFALSFYSVREMLLARSRLIQAQEQLRQASFRDPGTGLKNPSAYVDFLSTVSEYSFAQLSVVYIDINGLHELNNRLGHAAGDKLLRFVADSCVEQFPHGDVFRLGGDEFLLICSVCSEAETADRMERLNQKIEAAGYAISYGIEYRQSDFNIPEMVNRADEKMLKNKAAYYIVRDRRARL